MHDNPNAFDLAWHPSHPWKDYTLTVFCIGTIATWDLFNVLQCTNEYFMCRAMNYLKILKANSATCYSWSVTYICFKITGENLLLVFTKLCF